MKKIILPLIAAVLTFSSLAQASQVEVSGTAYSPDKCQYYSTNAADLTVSFQSPLSWGSKVILRYGFHNKYVSTDWAAQSQVEMEASSPYTWTASLKDITVDTRSGYFFDAIQFDFEIVSPQGAITYDNGGSTYGYFQAALPARSCQMLSQKPLDLEVVNK